MDYFSPFATQLDWNTPNPKLRDPWGLLLHTTGRGVPKMAKDTGKLPITVALDIYRKSQDGRLHTYLWGGPTYVMGHDGELYQLCSENFLTHHCGGSARGLYLSGSWVTKCSPRVVAEWHSRWGPTYKNPQQLYPSKNPNTDYCLDAGMRVLTADLRWIPVGNLVVGDRLVGFHEDLRPHNTTAPAEVTYTSRIVKPRVRVVTTHGELICSGDHMFVGKLGETGRARWLRANLLCPGAHLRYFAAPWATDMSYEAGWLAGMIDGEGHWAKSGELVVSQKIGPVLDRVLSVLARKGIEFRVYARDKDDVCQVSLRGAGTGLAHIGRFRPVRMLTKAELQWGGRRVYGKRTQKPIVIAVEPLGEGEVIAIKTTTRTFIAEGFLSHNCGVEMIPCGYGFGTPMGSGLLFTKAQHDSAVTLAKDIAARYKFKAGWEHTPRLLGHEDVQPIERHDAKGGWDPGFLREQPYFDFQYVRNAISK